MTVNSIIAISVYYRNASIEIKKNTNNAELLLTNKIDNLFRNNPAAYMLAYRKNRLSYRLVFQDAWIKFDSKNLKTEDGTKKKTFSAQDTPYKLG